MVTKADLSPQARCALRVYFGFGPNQKLSFNTPSRRTPECITALTELIEAGLIKVEPRNHYPDCPLDYSAEPGAYDLAQTITRADVKRGSFVAVTG